MKAVAITAFDTPPALREDLPAPTAAPNEVLVRVQASSVNAVDNSIASGMLKQMGVEYEAGSDPRVAARILPRDQHGQLERVDQAQLWELSSRGHRRNHIPALNRLLEDPVRAAL